MTLTHRRTWLRIGAAVLIGFGLLVALAAHAATRLPALLLIDLILWPFDGAETGAAPEARLAFAVGGGVMAGWGVMLWMLAGELLERMPGFTRRLIATSILAWFTVDSLGSLAAAAPLNVVGNCAFLAVFLLPLRGMEAKPTPV